MSMVATAANADHIEYANITIALTAGGTPVDMSGMVVSYTDSEGGHNANVQAGDGAATPDLFSCTDAIGGTTQAWCIGQKINYITGTANSGAMLDNNAQMVIIVGVPNTAKTNSKFTINFQPAVGAVLPITRTIPGSLNVVQPLY